MFRIILLICTALSVSTCSDKQDPSSTSPMSVAETQTKTTEFDAARAYEHVKAQIELGPRPAGSPANAKLRDYLVKELSSYGLKTTLDEFTPVTPQGKMKMANVLAELPGESTDVIIISSHYDTKLFKEFTFVGANDGASSTGALLEIARVMAASKLKPKFTYQFVFFDGEEAFCGSWSECLNGNDHTYGSSYMVSKLKKEKRVKNIKAMILMDMIGDKEPVFPREELSSKPLVQAIWSTAQELGYTKEFPDTTNQVTDDHVPFLQAGIPAVDIIDFDYTENDDDLWHTKHDTLDKISARSLKIVGDVILLSLPKIESILQKH